MLMVAVRTSETSVDYQFTRQYNPEDSSEHHTRRRENLKSHMILQALHYVSTHSLPFFVQCKNIAWFSGN
jgi:hypothetical protein